MPRKKAKAKRTPKARAPKPQAPKAEVDLVRVREVAATGVWTAGQVADIMGVSRTELLNGTVKEAVLDAIQQGKSLHFYEALKGYENAIASKNGNLSALFIFKLKQHGWRDRPSIDGDGAFQLELQGATDRFHAMFERYMRKLDSEGAA